MNAHDESATLAPMNIDDILGRAIQVRAVLEEYDGLASASVELYLSSDDAAAWSKVRPWEPLELPFTIGGLRFVMEAQVGQFEINTLTHARVELRGIGPVRVRGDLP